MYINRKTEYKLGYASTVITHYIKKKSWNFPRFQVDFPDPESDRIYYFTKCQRRGGLQGGFLNSKPNWSIFKDFFPDFQKRIKTCTIIKPNLNTNFVEKRYFKGHTFLPQSFVSSLSRGFARGIPPLYRLFFHSKKNWSIFRHSFLIYITHLANFVYYQTWFKY